MWRDYETDYSAALAKDSFLSWRELGARQKALNVARVCGSIKVNSAVEIGCGTGAVLRFLHSMHFAEEYACIDVAYSSVHFARQGCESFLRGAYVGSANALPFREGAFDVAILSHVVEHLDNPAGALREAARVARFVVVEVPTEKVLSNAIRAKVFGRPYASIAGAGHVQFWSANSIAQLLTRESGLTIIKRHRDLLNRETELFGKQGLSLVKPFLKETLKAALPNGIYSRLFTTHATFLCRSSALQGQAESELITLKRESV